MVVDHLSDVVLLHAVAFEVDGVAGGFFFVVLCLCDGFGG